jgi:hypothetical protein
MAFYRRYPILSGVLIACVGFPAVFFLLDRYPSLDPFLARNKPWWPMVLETVCIFPFVPYRLRPRHDSTGYWGLAAVLLALHVILLITFIRNVRLIAPFEYSIFGPFEVLVLGVLLYYGCGLFGNVHRRGPRIDTR